MRRKLPSTIALAVFESAARHGKFSRAASELCITESAVSRQISSLEAYLGVKLFSRVKKQVILNDAGKTYFKNIAGSLADIEMHTQAMMAHKGRGGILEVAVIPTFANRWLMPLLHDFGSKHPEILLNLSEKPDPFIFNDTVFDVALHFDHPSWAGVIKVDLFEEELVPVISPRHYEVSALKTPASMMDIQLLHKTSRSDAWKDWFALAGCAESPPALGMRFDLYGMVIEAARAGLGAGLVPRFYVGDEIRRGDLIIPFDMPLRHEKRYCILYPDYKQDSPMVKAFRDWVVSASQSFPPGKPLPH